LKGSSCLKLLGGGLLAKTQEQTLLISMSRSSRKSHVKGGCEAHCDMHLTNCCIQWFVLTIFENRGQVFQSLSVDYGLLFERCINASGAKMRGTDKRCHRERMSLHCACSSAGSLAIAPELHVPAQCYQMTA
jgi:hypothetical protein